MKQHVTILGSTGSIGTQSLSVVSAHPERFDVFALCAGRNTELLIDQAHIFHPKFVSSESDFDEARLPDGTKRLHGPHAMEEIASMDESGTVVGGVSGIRQLPSLLCALKSGKRVALANKESIVCGHSLVNEAVRSGSGVLIPVDSEQSAIFQCLSGSPSSGSDQVDHVLLTASGGPFWTLPYSEWQHITPEMALKHPTWNMGNIITVNSATLFNKGLEIIEACYLFHLPPEKIRVVIHPQSILHSAVSFADGSILANLAVTDMRIPIQYAMTWPDRIASPTRSFTLSDLNGLSFFPADPDRFRALLLAYECVREGGSAPVIYNASNEQAVLMFLQGKLRFDEIQSVVEDALSGIPHSSPETLEEIMELDLNVRKAVASRSRF